MKPASFSVPIRSPTATGLIGSLRLEGLVTFGEGDPGLLAANPDMPGQPQPRCVVERSGPDAHDAVARQAIDPACAIGAYEPGVEPPAIGHALERSRLARGQTKGRLRQRNSQREGAARDPLTVRAMAS